MWRVLLVTVLISGMGCQSPTSPSQNPEQPARQKYAYRGPLTLTVKNENLWPVSVWVRDYGFKDIEAVIPGGARAIIEFVGIDGSYY